MKFIKNLFHFYIINITSALLGIAWLMWIKVKQFRCFYDIKIQDYLIVYDQDFCPIFGGSYWGAKIPHGL